MDLFSVAANNGPVLEERMAALRAVLPDGERGCVDRFAERVEADGRIAINMRQGVLLRFLVSSTYQNIYDWAKSCAERSAKAVGEILEERLGPFYARRVAFDRSFEGGEAFRYGALNIGGAGATRYGSYCAVVGHAAPDKPEGRLRAAYLPGDSLLTYLPPGREAGVDMDAVRRDAAPHAHRHHLAALKLERQICGAGDERWPLLLCSGADYVEAIFAGELSPRDLESVRMVRSDYELFFAYAFEDFRAKLGEADRVLVDGFVSILELLEALGVTLEVVDD